jgi:two-component sensor histidine kinase
VVNELLTNALKYAFLGRKSGTVTLHSLHHKEGYRVVVADDGVGLPLGVEWPKPGGLGVLILDTLKENAKAEIEVRSSPEHGTRVEIVFLRPVN